jgi:tryptophanyl-tRNA synthetase
MTEQHTVLSGIRATGRLHFGNFLGAVINFVKFQNAGHTCLYFIADQHSLTTLDDPDQLINYEIISSKSQQTILLLVLIQIDR